MGNAQCTRGIVETVSNLCFEPRSPASKKKASRSSKKWRDRESGYWKAANDVSQCERDNEWLQNAGEAGGKAKDVEETSSSRELSYTRKWKVKIFKGEYKTGVS